MLTTCGTCGVEMDVRPYRLKKSSSGMVFCSNECQRTNPSVMESRAAKRRTSVERTCPVCGTTFLRKPSEAKAVNYCSYECGGRAAIDRGTLKPAPKGVRRSPDTEFQPGVRANNHAPVGTVRLRHRTRGDETRAFVKVAEPNVWRERARVVWEEHHGPIPRGHLIHHENRDPLDDRIENLRCLTRGEHAIEHSEETHAWSSA